MSVPAAAEAVGADLVERVLADVAEKVIAAVERPKRRDRPPPEPFGRVPGFVETGVSTVVRARGATVVVGSSEPFAENGVDAASEEDGPEPGTECSERAVEGGAHASWTSARAEPVPERWTRSASMAPTRSRAGSEQLVRAPENWSWRGSVKTRLIVVALVASAAIGLGGRPVSGSDGGRVPEGTAASVAAAKSATYIVIMEAEPVIVYLKATKPGWPLPLRLKARR